MKNIVLIGMPGSGKSTIGVILAKTLGMDFIDTDLLIQKSENDLLQNIIMNKGIEEFIKIEEKAVTGLFCTNSVIATGGSVVYSQKSIEHLKVNGLVIYLKVSYEEILRRVTNITSRGIVFASGQDLAGLYKERKPLYIRYSDAIIDCNGKDIEAIINEITNTLSNG